MNRTFFKIPTWVYLLILLLAGCTKDVSTIKRNFSLSNVDGAGLAPLYNNQAGANYVNDTYIVVLNDDVKENEVEGEGDRISRSFNGKKDKTFKYAIKGFTVNAKLADIEEMRKDPRIKYIEQEQIYSTETYETGATWGIDRVDQANLPLQGTYYYTSTGSGIDAYIIDTGIKFDHVDFGGRAITGFDAVTSGGTAADGNGHGTHVAGTIGSNTYGIAKGVRLIAVRVLDNAGSGTTTGVIAGLDWVTGNHQSGVPAVANMSLGGGASTALDDAVRRVVADGVVMCIAAGNSAADAINYSPARVTEAITVGATTSTDGFASYSNFGSVVDLLAPGTNITSTWNLSTTSTNTISGTSMATPHVTGLAALYVANNPTATPSAVETAMKASAAPNKISGVPAGTVNLLVQGVQDPVQPQALPPATPVLSSPADGSTGQSLTATVSWTAATGATSYTVQVSTISDFSSFVVNKSVTTTSTALSGLSNATTYYWRVIAVNSVGSATSATRSFTTLLAAPTLSSPSNGATVTTATPTLSWTSVTGATGYSVQVSTSNTFTTLISSGTPATNSFVVSPTLVKGTTAKTYYWRVLATKGSVSSVWSTVRSFKY